MAISPTFLMNQPVTKAGPNMPMLCHMITKAVASKWCWEWCSMAIGVAVIRIAITLCAISTDAVAATKVGWTTMEPSGRCFCAAWAGVSGGMLRNISTSALESVAATRKR